MKQVENLIAKNIKDFTTEDTIYITDAQSFNKQFYLCKFVRLENNKVTGTIILNNAHYENVIGKEITASVGKCALYGSSEMNGNSHLSIHRFDAMGYALNPIDAEKDTSEVHVPEHESYGMVGISKRSSRGTALFGSSTQHNQTISLTIRTAEHLRSLNNDRYYAKKQLIEIELSENQFAQLITSANVGDGIPCTIRSVNGKMTSEPPFQTKQNLFEGELKKEMTNLTKDLDKMVANTKAILEKPNVGKADREQIISDINRLYRVLSDHLPFLHTQFREQMDDVVSESKIQIEAFAENVIRNKGLEALAAANPEMREIILKLQGKQDEQD